jgi:hypothetical protein
MKPVLSGSDWLIRRTALFALRRQAGTRRADKTPFQRPQGMKA